MMYVGYHLGAGQPDPFSESTTIVYALPRASTFTLEMCDGQNQRVRLLASGTLGAGEYAVQWDGQDDAGKPAANGTYRSRLTVYTANGRVCIQTRHVTLQRRA